MEECEMLEAGKTHRGDFLGGTARFCPVEKCPYGNQYEMNWEGEPYTICVTDGLVEKAGKIFLNPNENVVNITDYLLFRAKLENQL